jgi:hypothetical protein
MAANQSAALGGLSLPGRIGKLFAPHRFRPSSPSPSMRAETWGTSFLSQSGGARPYVVPTD